MTETKQQVSRRSTGRMPALRTAGVRALKKSVTTPADIAAEVGETGGTPGVLRLRH